MPTLTELLMTIDLESNPKKSIHRHIIPEGTYITRVLSDSVLSDSKLVQYCINGPFTVDGIEYDISGMASPYANPMISLKQDLTPIKPYYADNAVFDREKQLHKEWKDLEWDPTIRL